jgi:hypothetical protein
MSTGGSIEHHHWADFKERASEQLAQPTPEI